jgi:hypothetical protein
MLSFYNSVFIIANVIKLDHTRVRVVASIGIIKIVNELSGLFKGSRGKWVLPKKTILADGRILDHCLIFYRPAILPV